MRSRVQEAQTQSGNGSEQQPNILSHFASDIHRDPKDNTKTKDRLEYYLWLAKIAEKGKISSIFFADSYGGHEIYAGNADAQYKGGSHVAKLEPTMLISAMATVTKSLGFGITGSTSYIRMYLSLPL